MTNSVIKICNFVHYFFREGGYLDCDQFSLLLFSLFMGGGRVKREIVPNSLYSLFFYFELFPNIHDIGVYIFMKDSTLQIQFCVCVLLNT